jgi:hypothetical protein
MKQKRFELKTLETYVWKDFLEFLEKLEILINSNASGCELEDLMGEFMQEEKYLIRETIEQKDLYPKVTKPIKLYDYIYLPIHYEFLLDLEMNTLGKNHLEEVKTIINRDRDITNCKLKFLDKMLNRQKKKEPSRHRMFFSK